MLFDLKSIIPPKNTERGISGLGFSIKVDKNTAV